jgi:hypothetical protein
MERKPFRPSFVPCPVCSLKPRPRPFCDGCKGVGKLLSPRIGYSQDMDEIFVASPPPEGTQGPFSVVSITRPFPQRLFR